MLVRIKKPAKYLSESVAVFQSVDRTTEIANRTAASASIVAIIRMFSFFSAWKKRKTVQRITIIA